MTEAVLYFAVIFAPWAFGTTARWSIWTMNVAAYALGALLIAKWLIRWRTGYLPLRWGEAASGSGSQKAEAGSQKQELGNEGEKKANSEDGTQNSRGQGQSMMKVLTATLATLTIAILAYCLISAINARSTFYYRQLAFEPHDYVAWLPHSYDSWATWQAFWMYLGLAWTFWAARDWALGKSTSERRESRADGQEPDDDSGVRTQRSAFSTRLQRLLWVLCLNGAVLALEGILQRLSGTNRLLWQVQPEINRSGELQFGPYAYRSNAAQYLNLLWPVCLGFWWTLRRAHQRSGRAGARLGSGPQVLLLPCAVLMAAAPIISTSRGGAVVAAAEMLVALALLMVARSMRLGMVVLFAAALGLAGSLGWESLGPRLNNIFADNLGGRIEIYRNAEQMARDFPVFGTGPGTFPWVYLLYRSHAQAGWAGYAHNDWLETRITFGWVGLALIIAALAVVLPRWFCGVGVPAPWPFVSLIWLALVGCLVHARFDFPFQIYSTLALFLHSSVILFCLARKR